MNDKSKKEYILEWLKDINFYYNNPNKYDDLKRLLDEMEEEIIDQCCEDGIMYDAKTLSEEINNG